MLSKAYFHSFPRLNDSSVVRD